MKRIIGQISGTSVVNLWETEKEFSTAEEVLESDVPFSVMSIRELMSLANRERWDSQSVDVFTFEA